MIRNGKYRSRSMLIKISNDSCAAVEIENKICDNNDISLLMKAIFHFVIN